MRADEIKQPFLTAAMAGGVLFLWAGVFEAAFLLFFEGALIKYAGMNDWVRLFANLDSGLFLFAGVLYGILGLGIGLGWWLLASWAGTAVRRLRKKTPRQAGDFFGLYLYVGLSLVVFLLCVPTLFLLDPALNPDAGKVSLPGRILLGVLVCVMFWGSFRLLYWILNRGLPSPRPSRPSSRPGPRRWSSWSWTRRVPTISEATGTPGTQRPGSTPSPKARCSSWTR